MSEVTLDPRQIFLDALERHAPEEVERYVDEACGGNAEVRARVLALLRAHRDVGNFLGGPPASIPTVDEPMTEKPGALIGPYKLIEQIGEGGMGTVWMAQQTEPVKRVVALKLIKAGMDSKQVIARFEAERQALALMDHPNIARVLDAGTTSVGRPYFVMDLVKGVPITRYCDAHHLTPRQRLELFIPVCLAVQHAHQKGIIHRDLKPSNVLVALYDGRPVPRVIDFGVAKAAGQQLTEKTLVTGFGSIVGTLEYMSPEQAEVNNQDIDTRSDIYSLGVLLYELLAGSPPFTRKELEKAGMLEMLRVIREQEPSKPSTRLSTAEGLPTLAANRGTEPAKLTRLVRGELDWIVMKALDKDRSRRYETANALAMELQRHLCDEPVVAGPPSALYRFRKLVRRHKGPVSAACLVALALVAGLIGTTIGLFRAEHQRQIAEHAQLQTERRLVQIEKGVKLFAGMLEGINPLSEKPGDPTVYEQLRQRAENVADELRGDSVADPLAVARLQTILGNTLLELGNRTKAVSVLEQARLAQESQLGADHPDTLDTLNNLAAAYYAAGRFAEAIQLFEQVSGGYASRLGADHRQTLAAQNSLAAALQASGKLAEAIGLYEQVRDAQLIKLGPNDPDTLITLNNLAEAYRPAGRLPEAIRLFEQVRDAQVAKLGVNHASTLITLNNLARAYQADGKLREAIQLFAQVRDAQSLKLGANHPDTLTTSTNLAWAYMAADKLREAIGLYEQIRDAQVAKLGADHPNTLYTLNDLALAYKAAGKLPEAIRLLKQVHEARVAKLGADHPGSLSTLGNLAKAHLAAGDLQESTRLFEQAALGIEKRQFQHEHAAGIIHDTVSALEKAKQFARAENWQRKWLAVVRAKAGVNSSAAAAELGLLGLNLLQQKKWQEAEAVLRDCLGIRDKNEPDVWTTFNTRSLLGGALLGQANYADAEPLLLAGYEGMKKQEPKIPAQGKPRLAQALERLVQLNEATGRPSEAAKWRRELEARKK